MSIAKDKLTDEFDKKRSRLLELFGRAAIVAEDAGLPALRAMCERASERPLVTAPESGWSVMFQRQGAMYARAARADMTGQMSVGLRICEAIVDGLGAIDHGAVSDVI